MSAVAERGATRHVPFAVHLGIERVRCGDGQAELRVALTPQLRDHHGAGHGGVLATLLDAAMAHAALSRVDYAREVVTVDLHIAFLVPAAGDHLVAFGQASGGGRSVCFCEARVESESGQLLAQAMGTFRYREAG